MFNRFVRVQLLLVALLFLYLNASAVAKANDVRPPLNRDEIDHENMVRTFRQAALLAKQEKLKQEAIAVEAARTLERTRKLRRSHIASEGELREKKYRAESSNLQIAEQAHLINQLELDADISELYRRWAIGEKEDLATLADLHVVRWSSVLEQGRVALKKALAHQELAEWNLNMTSNLHPTGAATKAEHERMEMHAAIAKAEVELAKARINEAERSVADALKTLARAKAETGLKAAPTL